MVLNGKVDKHYNADADRRYTLYYLRKRLNMWINMCLLLIKCWVAFVNVFYDARSLSVYFTLFSIITICSLMQL